MPASDPWLSRQNDALKLRGLAVSLELFGTRIRLRASMPPRPTDPPATPWRQQRFSTGLAYPAQAAAAVEQAEVLGRALERARLGETFDWAPWDAMGRRRRSAAPAMDGISGQAAIRQAYGWWSQQRKRGRSADATWDVDYRQPLAALRTIETLEPRHLLALVGAAQPASRSRLRAARAAAAVAQALGWGDELVGELRQRGKGYSAADAAPRELPRDREIEALVDRLPPDWQWPVAVVATYGCRPHEALLHAEVLPSGLVRINDGKTGARQSLAMPAEWIRRWSLNEKRLPPTMTPGRDHRAAGMAMGRKFRRVGASCVPYDLRHAWAVRAIHNPKISPSLAAKSMGHSLAVHSSIYQRWFDAAEMESLQVQLNAAI
ncbi:MAG: integrase [Cyanobacteria bacterium J06638_7]